jgi:Domain of unknown function (DUF4260)
VPVACLRVEVSQITESDASAESAEPRRDTVITVLRPGVLVRLEGLVALTAAVIVYLSLGGNWITFAILFLVPDVSMVAYVAGPRTGAAIYNLIHTYAAPALIASVGLATKQSFVVFVALILFAHIGLDRLLGYGLKYPSAFKDTHLQRLE